MTDDIDLPDDDEAEDEPELVDNDAVPVPTDRDEENH